MSGKHDLHWWKILGGADSSIPGGDPDSTADAQVLLRIIEARVPLQNPAPRAEELERLLFQARRRGILARKKKPWWRSPQKLSAIAAAPLVAAFALSLFLQQHPGDSIDGSSWNEAQWQITKALILPQPVFTPQPSEAAAEFARQLADQDARVKQETVGESFQVRAIVPQPTTKTLSTLLARHQITLSSDGRLWIEFLPPENHDGDE